LFGTSANTPPQRGCRSGELLRARRHLVEQLVGQPQQLRVAQREHPRTARLVQQPARLAHPLAALDLRGRRAVRAHANAESTARHEVHSVRDGAGLEQHRAGGQGEMLGAGGERLEGRKLDAGEIDAARQAVDGAAQLERRMRLFFRQGHALMHGRERASS
jgi:hypothetical protein